MTQGFLARNDKNITAFLLLTCFIFIIYSNTFNAEWHIDDFINIGATIGFRNFFGDEFDIIDPFSEDSRSSALRSSVSVEDAQFLPIAAAGRVKFFDVFSAGLDVGYAIGLTDGLDGGFYIKPVVGWDVLDFLEINLGYENISDAATWGNFNLGVLFQF